MQALVRQSDPIAHSPLGCYTILFILAVYLRLTGPERQPAYKSPLFIITVILYLLCSAHFALDFAHYYITLVCALPYSSYAISEHRCRVLQVSKDSQT